MFFRKYSVGTRFVPANLESPRQDPIMVLGMGPIVSVSRSEPPPLAAVWILASKGDPSPLSHFIANIPFELQAAYLNYEDKDYRPAPVVIATRKGHVDCVRILLQAGADANRVGREGESPLHYAVKTHNLAILRLLLMYARVDCNVVDSHGYTPLLLAVANDKTKALALLSQCDRVNRFARHAKSGLNALELAQKTNDRASSIDRPRLKARLELLEQVRIGLERRGRLG